MDDELREAFDTQIDNIERRIEDGIAQVETLADKANLLRSMPRALVRSQPRC
jgi:transposase